MNVQAIKIAYINAALNGLAEYSIFYAGDLLHASKISSGLDKFASTLGMSFDTICCNPPLLPVPDNCPFPLVGAGGTDGLAFAKVILAHLDRLLSPTGRCHIIGTLQGSELEPELQQIDALAVAHRLRVLLVIPVRLGIRRNDPLRNLLGKH